MLKIGTVISGSTLRIQYGPKFEPPTVAVPAPPKPEIVTRGYRSAMATPICAFAEIKRCSASRMSGRRVSRSSGSPVGKARCGHLLVERPSARDRPGVAPEQDVDAVLGLLDLTLELGDRLGRAVVQRLGLAQVENAGHAAVEPGLHQVDRLRARTHRAPGDLQRQVQRAQRQVGLADVRDQRRHDRVARVLGGEQLGPRRFGVALELAPEVDLPGRAEPDLRHEAVVRGCRAAGPNPSSRCRAR